MCVDKVKRLKSLCDVIPEFEYEIIVADDGSVNKDVIIQNQTINNLEHCTLLIRKVNGGSAATRNFLAENSKYAWLLFLDCDMDIPDNHFIERYIYNGIYDTVVNGGIAIGSNPSEMKGNLRYLYEHYEEPKHTAEQRNKKPYKAFRSTNFMIPREIFLSCKFDERMKRYEDVYFGKILKQKNIRIKHIDNPVVLNDFEDNYDYMNKIELDLRTLCKFRNELQGYSKMITFTDTLRHKFPTGLIKLWHKIFGKMERNSLTGKHPNLKVFNIYRLGYFISNNN